MWDSVAWAQGISGRTGARRWPPVISTIRPDLRHFLFHADSAAAEAQEAVGRHDGCLKKGDKVVTASGIWGTITNMGKDTVTLQIADNDQNQNPERAYCSAAR